MYLHTSQDRATVGLCITPLFCGGVGDARQVTASCTPPKFARPSSRPYCNPRLDSFLIGDSKFPIQLLERIKENIENQVDCGDGEGAGGELRRLLEEKVARCATAGAGVPGQDVGRSGDEDCPAAMKENHLMTSCHGLLRGCIGGTAACGAPGCGQEFRLPVMLHIVFDEE